MRLGFHIPIIAQSISLESTPCTAEATRQKEKKENRLLFKQTPKSRLTFLACRHLSFLAKKLQDRERPFFLFLFSRVVSLFLCLSRLAPSVTRVVICVSPAFCSTDQENRTLRREGLLPLTWANQSIHGLGKVRIIHGPVA